jgi:hypothetical protein
MTGLWIKIRSFHAVRNYNRAGGVETYCGRTVGSLDEPPQTVDALPGGKSCETCLRLYARQADVDVATDEDVGE